MSPAVKNSVGTGRFYGDSCPLPALIPSLNMFRSSHTEWFGAKTLLSLADARIPQIKKAVRSTPSSGSLGLTKSIMSFYSTQIAKSNHFQEDLSTFGEQLRSGLAKLASPIPVGQS